MIMKGFLILTCMLAQFLIVISDGSDEVIQSEPTCKFSSSPSQNGVCKKLNECQPLLTLIQKKGGGKLMRQIIRRRYRCQSDRTKVCCPPTLPTSESPKQTPTPTPRPKRSLSRIGLLESFGIPNSSEHIFGGVVAIQGSHPWMVALLYKSSSGYKLICGGSLISNQWVITAAHCVKDFDEQLFARLGDVNLPDPKCVDSGSVTTSVEKAFSHPGYSKYPTLNDIALLKLSRRVTLTNFIRPIPILRGSKYEDNTFYENKESVIAGWGKMKEDGESTPHLLETRITLVNMTHCKEMYANQNIIVVDDTNICAKQRGKDSCHGDSGGPLTMNLYGVTYLAGIVSRGHGCAHPRYPGVYTKVATYAGWISDVTGLF